jgi:hypothetical protein
MRIKDYETNIGGQGPVRVVELLGKKLGSDHFLSDPLQFIILSFLLCTV